MFILDHMDTGAIFEPLSAVTPNIVPRHVNDPSDDASSSPSIPQGALAAIIAGGTLLLLCALCASVWHIGLCGLGKIKEERRARRFQVKRNARQSLFAADLDEKRPQMSSAFTSPNHSRATSPAPNQDWSYSFAHLHDEKRTPAPSRRASLGPPEQDPVPAITNALTTKPSTSREHSPVRDASSSLHDHLRRPKPKPKLVLAYRPPPSGDDPFTPVETPAPVIRAFIRTNPEVQMSHPASGHVHEMPLLPRLPQVPLPEKALVQERRPLPVPQQSFSSGSN